MLESNCILKEQAINSRNPVETAIDTSKEHTPNIWEILTKSQDGDDSRWSFPVLNKNFGRTNSDNNAQCPNKGPKNSK